LGGALSQFRAGLEGVANSRACGWNRPRSTAWPTSTSSRAISLAQLIGGIEHGILMSHQPLVVD
jgi:predicted Zn-dependent protease